MPSDAASNTSPVPGKPARPPALARSAWLRLFVMFRRVLRPEQMLSARDAHLAYMVEQERGGVLFLSGPITSAEDAATPNGMSVLRASDIDEARRIADGDPYVQRGVMSFTLAEWTIVEGSLPITVTLSDSGARIG